MNHLTWPDAFAVAALVAGFVVFFYFLFRATGRGDFDMGSSLHRERMVELKDRRRERRPVPDFATTTTTTAFEIPLTAEALAILAKAGVLVKNDDGSYKIVVPTKPDPNPAPLVTPPPKEPPDAVP